MLSSKPKQTCQTSTSPAISAGRLMPLSMPGLDQLDIAEKILSTHRVKLKLPCSGDQCQTATLLVKQAYVWGNSTVTNFNRRPNKIALSMFFGEAAISTITLHLDSPAGLGADNLYKREMDLLRQRGHKVCEFTQITLDQNIRSKRVLSSLFHIAYLYATRMYGCTDVLVEASTRRQPFFQNSFGFELFGKEKESDRTASPVVLLRLPKDHVEAKLNAPQALFSDDAPKQLYTYFFDKTSVADLLQKLGEGQIAKG